MESFGGTDAVIETLRTRGWSFSDLDQIGAMIAIQSAMADDGTLTADFVEKELVNMDLRSIGAKSLPEPTLFRKSTHLHGPKVLQISSARDISRNSIERVSGSSSSRRLLRLGLTDGHSEIVAVEFSHIPALPDNVVPGTKVRLENKAPVHSGIVCLNSKVITVLGGVVQSLHEEWQMNQKYAGFARSSLKISQEGDIGGPPQFEKLQIGPPSRRLAQQGRNSNNLEPASSSSGGLSSKKAIRNNDFRPTGKHLNSDSKLDHSNNSSDKAPQTQSTEEKPSGSERPKEVAESAPVQNQAAAQKLLQKMNQPNNDRFSRGRRQKGRAWQEEEEQQVFTLEEYEKRKAGAQPIVMNELPDTRRDEELAWRMQNQFDLEDSHVQRSHPGGEAENIRMNMFSYERDDDRDGSMGYGGRGRGRGRGRGGGRGRGRGGGRGRVEGDRISYSCACLISRYSFEYCTESIN